MTTTITEYSFRQAFHDMDRGNNFSYHGLTALFNALEEYEDCTEEKIELDVIALCCEFTEYADLEEFQADYGEGYETIEDIENQTWVIRVDADSFIIQSF